MLTITLQKTYYQIIIFKSIPKVVFLGKNISPFNWIVLEDPVTKNSEKKLVPFFSTRRLKLVLSSTMTQRFTLLASLIILSMATGSTGKKGAFERILDINLGKG